MKRSIIAIVAFSLLAPGMALAQSHSRGPDDGRRVESRHDRRPDAQGPRAAGHQQRPQQQHPQYQHPQQHRQQKHSWRKGERVPPQYRQQHIDYRRHGLKKPPRGQEWVRVDNNYALISAATGLIVALSQIR